ncbi:hypothetical protein LCGC14_2195830, partial [marine sediment metagenome]
MDITGYIRKKTVVKINNQELTFVELNMVDLA